MKTMNGRDQARDDLYLAQLRLQSAPNTPGFAGFSSNPPKSPFVSAAQVDPYSAAEKGQAPRSPTTTQYASPRSPTRPVPSFQLQPPPIRVQQPTPKTNQGEFSAPSQTPSPPPQSAPQHVAAAPGETEYAAVPIPGGYTSPMGPTFPPAVHQ